VHWQKEPTVVLEAGEGTALDKWFPDGEMSMCYNCVDRHLEDSDTKGDDKCFLYSSA